MCLLVMIVSEVYIFGPIFYALNDNIDGRSSLFFYTCEHYVLNIFRSQLLIGERLPYMYF